MENFAHASRPHPLLCGQHRPHTDRASTRASSPLAVGPWQAKQGGAEGGAQVMSTNDAPPNRGASPDTEPESQTKKRKQGKAHEGPVDYGPYLQLDNVQSDTSGRRRVRLGLASLARRDLRGRAPADTSDNTSAQRSDH